MPNGFFRAGYIFLYGRFLGDRLAKSLSWSTAHCMSLVIVMYAYRWANVMSSLEGGVLSLSRCAQVAAWGGSGAHLFRFWLFFVWILKRPLPSFTKKPSTNEQVNFQFFERTRGLGKQYPQRRNRTRSAHSNMAREQNRAIALLGALIVVCQPCSAFVSVVGPAAVVRSSYGAGLRPSSSSVPSSQHARGSLAGQRSRAGSALSMGAKSVGTTPWFGSVVLCEVDVVL